MTTSPRTGTVRGRWLWIVPALSLVLPVIAILAVPAVGALAAPEARASALSMARLVAVVSTALGPTVGAATLIGIYLKRSALADPEADWRLNRFARLAAGLAGAALVSPGIFLILLVFVVGKPAE
jgi:hypothetical protein